MSEVPQDRPAGRFFYGWVVVFVAACLGLLGPGFYSYSRGVFLPALAEELASYPGSGKAAKLARKLASLKAGDPTPARRAAAEAALAARIERAKRWRESDDC